MPDGAEQGARDWLFDAKLEEAVTNPDKWSDPSWQEYAWGWMLGETNYISTVQPFSLSNVRHPLPLAARPPWPTFHYFVQRG